MYGSVKFYDLVSFESEIQHKLLRDMYGRVAKKSIVLTAIPFHVTFEFL